MYSYEYNIQHNTFKYNRIHEYMYKCSNTNFDIQINQIFVPGLIFRITIKTKLYQQTLKLGHNSIKA